MSQKHENEVMRVAKHALWTFAVGAGTRIAELPGGHILERIRVWLNTNPEKKHAISHIYQNGGMKNFYQGILWNFFPAMIKSGNRWLNTYVSEQMISSFISPEYKLTKAAAIGLIAPAVTTSMYCPFERMKVDAMTGGKPTFSQLTQMRGLWNGWRPMYAKEAVISFTFNVLYAQYLKMFGPYRSFVPFEQFHTTLIAASVGMTCAIITTPLDLLKDQMQMHQNSGQTRLLQVLTTFYQKHGLYPMIRTAPVKIARSAWYFGATTFFMHYFNALPKFMQLDNDNDS